MIPVQKSTLGYNDLSLKYLSFNAIDSNSNAISINGSFPTKSNT